LFAEPIRPRLRLSPLLLWFKPTPAGLRPQRFDSRVYGNPFISSFTPPRFPSSPPCPLPGPFSFFSNTPLTLPSQARTHFPVVPSKSEHGAPCCIVSHLLGVLLGSPHVTPLCFFSGPVNSPAPLRIVFLSSPPLDFAFFWFQAFLCPMPAVRFY